ncbi:DISARM system helicase DrmA [Myxococcota bacterium]|nr:DISARM system helicase DrmA [Myxococcota bacterium]
MHSWRIDLAGESTNDLEVAEASSSSAPPHEIRDELNKLVLADLLGPFGGEDEEVDETRVSDRYLLGMLAPRRQKVAMEEDEELANAGPNSPGEGSTESTTAPAESMFPSSMGMTFTVAAGVDSIQAQLSWGRYSRVESDELETDAGNPKKVWRRTPMGGQIDVPMVKGAIAAVSPDADQPEVTLQGLVRERKGQWVVTLFLVNEQEEPDALRDEGWIFQPKIRVEGDEDQMVFVRRPYGHDAERWDAELLRETRELEMLYRKQVEFASGHGVAVHVKTKEGDSEHALSIETSVAPTYDIPQQTPPTEKDEGFEKLAGLELDMAVLGETASADFAAKLSPLTEAYVDWIAAERRKLDKPAEGLGKFADVAGPTLDRCETARRRIEDGIALLGRSEKAAEAFRFANRAMALQRIHSIFSEGRRRGEEVLLEDLEADPMAHSWRPFQLAFVLLNLASTADLHHEQRSHETEAVADLLWFPTGGGKTEAYLGLAAFVMGLRRLEGEIEGRVGEHGVAVIMRYTLRLLTLQQFQRATALICACESIRRTDAKKWGENPFRIGLWVGAKAAPNWTKESSEWLKNKRDPSGSPFGRGGGGSPSQLNNCPWCGEKVDDGRDVMVESFKTGRARTLSFCGDKKGRCEFSRAKSPGEGLPVVVVDEELYRLLPSLIIATVDKFAQMPWNGRTQMLFGQVDGYCPRHGFRSPEVEDSNSHPKKGDCPAVKTIPHGPLRPPDLIIQDELHLISGPLGSMTGLYETAVDELCSWEVGGQRVRPKVIASTATIRNAEAQVHGLFLRQVEIFPPPGTSIDNNFFSIQRKPSARYPGRRYIGVCAPGKRLKAILIRTYMAYLGAGQLMYEKYGKDADSWMTLLGYFNSIRELGGMRRLVEDDIRQRLRKISIRGLGDRALRPPEELTSRKSSSDIPQILDRLEVEFDPADDARRKQDRKEGKRPQKLPPYDVVLATNMVSVGVDVKRLGLMVVGGQPKATAEYIQATSRVGRHHPGIVCAVYNWARPRDLSHYERFEHYHATFYERVESLSVTPFAPRAVDRGLSALFVAMVRLLGGDLNDNAKASDIERNHPFVTRAIDTISKRAAHVLRDQNAGDEIRAQLMNRLDEWLSRTSGSGGGQLAYRGKRDGTTVPLMEQPSETGWDTFTCLNSLRDVEPTSNFILVENPTRASGRRSHGGSSE